MDLGPQWQAPDHAQVDSLEKHVELSFEQATDPTREPVPNEDNTKYWMSEPEGDPAWGACKPVSALTMCWGRRYRAAAEGGTGEVQQLQVHAGAGGCRQRQAGTSARSFAHAAVR